MGTRGDIQPIMLLARAYASSAVGRSARVVTHEHWRALCAELCGTGSNVEFVGLPCLPAREWETVGGAAPQQDASVRSKLVDGCRGAKVICFNLFCLDAWHVAEHLGKGMVRHHL